MTPPPVHHQPVGVLDRLRATMDVLVREAVKFGAVGTLALVVDVGVFNLMRFGLGDGGPLESRPLTAKVVSAGVATLVAWLGNRYWTFRHRRRSAAHHELALFVVFNVVGMSIAVVCLGFSHYVLGLRSALADNVSANVVGLALGTLFRFWAYRRYVFTNELQGTALAPDAGRPPLTPAAASAPGHEAGPHPATPDSSTHRTSRPGGQAR